MLEATLGQEWLADRLGVFPTSGWHMDPVPNAEALTIPESLNSNCG